MKRFDTILLFLLVSGLWAWAINYFSYSQRAESQDFYYEVKEAVNNCSVFGRVIEDFYGAHRLEAKIDCGPTWIDSGGEE
jgi:hypothetical protein